MIAAAVVSVLVAGIATLVSAGGLPPGGTFVDDDGNIHEGNIEAIAARGITGAATRPPTTATAPGIG